jgi:Tol biopolymer transport system component
MAQLRGERTISSEYHVTIADSGIAAVVFGVLCVAGCGRSSAGTNTPPVPVEEITPAVPAVALQASLPAGLSGHLTFHSDRDGRHKLFTVDLATSLVTQVTQGRDHHDEDATSSPDGTRIAFTTTRFDARTWDIAVASAAAVDVRQVTSHLAFDRHAAWMPDGQSLLFSSEQEGTQAVFRTWLDSGHTARVSPPPQRALMPAPSPDGARVAYVMGTADGFRLAVQDLATNAVRMVTPPEENAVEPRWSPDGKRLAYVRMLPSRSFIAILVLDSGTMSTLAVEGLDALREPAWSRDGKWLVAAGSPGSGGGEDWDLILLQPDPPGAAFRVTAGRNNDRAPEWMPR